MVLSSFFTDVHGALLSDSRAEIIAKRSSGVQRLPALIYKLNFVEMYGQATPRRKYILNHVPINCRWLGSRVVSVLDSGAEGPGFKSQSRRCRVTVLGKLFNPLCLCSPSSKIGSSPLKGCGGNCGPGGK